jgi:hypothetical protein
MVIKRDRPIMTWVGGTCAVPSACLIKESTTTIRVKHVVITNIAGRKDRSVINTIISRGVDKPNRVPVAGAWGGAARTAAGSASRPVIRASINRIISLLS